MSRRTMVIGLGLALAACGGGAARPDGGSALDGGDSGTADAAVADAGGGDGGLVDGGEPDGGPLGDGGSDGGLDGGLDGGVDAGSCWYSPGWNLAPNGGFECDGGSMAPWQVGSGTAALVPGRDGGWAVRLTVGSSGSVALSTAMPLLARPPPPTVVCARAWVKGTTGNARLEALRLPVGQADTFTEPLLGAGWQVVPPSAPLSATVTAVDDAYLRLQLLNAPVGSTVDIDDLVVWRSTSQQCPLP